MATSKSKSKARKGKAQPRKAPSKASKSKAQKGKSSKAQSLMDRLQAQQTRLEGLGDLSSRPRAEHGAIPQADGAPARDPGAGNLLPAPHGTDPGMVATEAAKEAIRAMVGKKVFRVRNGERQEGTAEQYRPGKADPARPFSDPDGEPEGPHARILVLWSDGKRSTVNYGRVFLTEDQTQEGSAPLTRQEAEGHRKDRQEAAAVVKTQAQDIKAQEAQQSSKEGKK